MLLWNKKGILAGIYLHAERHIRTSMRGRFTEQPSKILLLASIL